MIARIWTGRTRSEDADTYLEYLHDTGITALRGTPGNRGAWALRRVDAQDAEFQVISLWDSMDAIHAFAGDELAKAVYYPDDERYLLEMAPEVMHYEIYGTEGAANG